ncbi:MAG: hypothetical protein ACPGNT_03250, partial [Rhodospirillales bacterium]
MASDPGSGGDDHEDRKGSAMTGEAAESADKDIGIHTEMASLRNWGEPAVEDLFPGMKRNTSVDCGWGRLFFGQTYEAADRLVDDLRGEKKGQRDIALYLREPAVAVSLAPQELFLDPSLTYRLVFDGSEALDDQDVPFLVRPLDSHPDAEAAQRIYAARGMVPPYDGYLMGARDMDVVTVLVAEDHKTGDVIGVVYGVDHAHAFNDPDNGSSLWALAVDPQCVVPGVG